MPGWGDSWALPVASGGETENEGRLRLSWVLRSSRLGPIPKTWASSLSSLRNISSDFGFPVLALALALDLVSGFVHSSTFGYRQSMESLCTPRSVPERCGGA